MNANLVAGTDTDETTQDILEFDYEYCECLGTYQEDISLGNGAEWIKCGCGQWLNEKCVENTATDVNGVVRFCSTELCCVT